MHRFGIRLSLIGAVGIALIGCREIGGSQVPSLPPGTLCTITTGATTISGTCTFPSPGAQVPPPGSVPPPSTQQVIRVNSPAVLGTVADPVFGTVGGYTQSLSSQVMAFAPGTQVMIANVSAPATGKTHTLNVLGTSSFPDPASTTLSKAASGGNTLTTGYASGDIVPGKLVGPVTLLQGTYYIGCAYHYPDGHRDVIVVQANATPGPQATPPPSATPLPVAPSPLVVPTPQPSTSWSKSNPSDPIAL